MHPLTHLPRTAILATLGLGVFVSIACPAKKPEGPDVLVVSDVTKEYRDTARPTPDRPVYYVLLGSTEWTMGAATANMPMPKREEFEAIVEQTLESQGFVRTHVGGPMPSLAIVATWGEANVLEWEYEEPGEDAEGLATSTTVSGSFNQRQIAQLAGADKPGVRRLPLGELDEIRYAMQSDRLYLFIGALDFDALRRKEKKLVWRVRMSIPARRNSLPEAMPAMLASAAPFMGRDMDAPLVIDEAGRKAKVELGDLQVIELDTKEGEGRK